MYVEIQKICVYMCHTLEYGDLTIPMALEKKSTVSLLYFIMLSHQNNMLIEAKDHGLSVRSNGDFSKKKKLLYVPILDFAQLFSLKTHIFTYFCTNEKFQQVSGSKACYSTCWMTTRITCKNNFSLIVFD